MINIAKGLKVAHDEDIVHGDVSPGNILIFDGIAKLTDFGMSKVSGTIATPTKSGSLKDLRVARAGPEVVWGGRSRTEKSDIFAFGSLVYELFTRDSPHFNQSPFTHPPPPDLTEKVIADCSWNKDSWTSLWKVVQDCWKEDPDERPSASKLVSRLTDILQSLQTGDQKTEGDVILNILRNRPRRQKRS